MGKDKIFNKKYIYNWYKIYSFNLLSEKDKTVPRYHLSSISMRESKKIVVYSTFLTFNFEIIVDPQ